MIDPGEYFCGDKKWALIHAFERRFAMPLSGGPIPPPEPLTL
jgi:hypothetical protein